MKAKKFIALAMSVAMAVGTASMLAACNSSDEGDKNDNQNNSYSEDTRIWYAVGRNTKGTLKEQGWNKDDSTHAFVRDTTVTDENVFTISLDIYSDPAGYGFKFLFKNSEDEADVPWTRQVGIHHFADVEGEDKDAVLKNEAGETVFTTKDGTDANNLYLAKGHDGTYEFTIKTKNDTDTNPVITWKKTAAIEVPYDMYLRGDRNNFSEQNMVEMTETLGTGTVHTTWSADLEVTDNDLWRKADGTEVEASENDPLLPDGTGEYTAIQLFNAIDKKTYVVADESFATATVKFGKNDYSVMLLPKGDYTITFDAVDKSVTVVQFAHKIFFSGDFNDNKPTADDMLNKGAGVWTGYLTVDADASDPDKVTSVSLYDSVTKQSTEAVELKAGVYAFKYTESSGTAEYEEAAYWLVGTFVDPRTDANVNFAISEGITPRFEATETEGEYKATFKAEDVTTRSGYDWIKGSAADGIFAIQVVYGTNLLGVKDWNSSGENQYLTEAGVWEITFAGGPVTWAAGDPEKVPTPPALQYEMYLIGGFNSWAEGDANYAMEYKNGTWVGYLNVTADNTDVKLFNKTTGTYFTTAELGSANITLNKGYYMFVFLENGNEVKYDAVDVYIIGTFLNADNTKLNFSIAEGVTPKFTAGTNPNELTLTYTVVDVTSVYGSFDGWTQDGSSAGAVFVWKPIATCSLAEYSGNSAGTIMWDVCGVGNQYVKATGEHTFTYNVVTHAVSATPTTTPAE